MPNSAKTMTVDPAISMRPSARRTVSPSTVRHVVPRKVRSPVARTPDSPPPSADCGSAIGAVSTNVAATTDVPSISTSPVTDEVWPTAVTRWPKSTSSTRHPATEPAATVYAPATPLSASDAAGSVSASGTFSRTRLM